MLFGFVMSIYWLPGDEHGSDGDVKTLEEWQVGRGVNTFSQTWLARVVATRYRWCAGVGDRVLLWLNKISGGDEAERRKMMRELGEERLEAEEEARMGREVDMGREVREEGEGDMRMEMEREGISMPRHEFEIEEVRG